MNEFKEKRLRNNVKKTTDSTVKKRKKRLRKKRVKKSSQSKKPKNGVTLSSLDTHSNVNTIIEENKASEYEFQSRTDFNSDEAAQDEANQEEEDEDAAAEESSDQSDEDEDEDCEDDEESQGGSNRAYQNTDSECDSSNSMDDNFYYEKFKSKSASVETEKPKVFNEYSHDDDEDILCSNLDFKLLD